MHVVVKELARFSGEADVRARKQTTIPRQVLVERLIEPAYRAAQLGHGKVFIVDEAHLLGPDGQNALLKTLEEPPAGTTIMLVTDAVDRLLATVRSRSHLVPFVPLAEAQLEAWLDARARADPDSPAASLSDSQRAAVVRMSSGSPGLAALVLQRGLVEWLDAVSPMLGDLARGRTVPELGPALAERIDGYASQWVKDHPQASKEAANHRAAGLMGTLVQGCARAGLAAASAKAPADDPEAAWDRLGPWVRMIDAVVENQQLLSANVNTKHAAEDLGAQLNLAWSR
jgi:DNA polymerase-3 subunit delta'